jgi:hypothetical protein
LDIGGRCIEERSDGEKSVVEALPTPRLETPVVGGEVRVSSFLAKAALMHRVRKEGVITGRKENKPGGVENEKAAKSERTYS